MDQDKEMAIDIKKIIDSIDDYRVPDDYFDLAYKEVTPHHRSIIKKSIALNYNYLSYKFHNNFNKKTSKSIYDNIEITRVMRKKGGTFVFLSKEIDSPAQVISLVLPPRLLGVTTIVMGLYEKWPKTILTTLELMGISDVYTISQDIYLNFFKKIHSSCVYIYLGESNGIGHQEILYLSPPKWGLVLTGDNQNSSINIEYISILHPGLKLKEITFQKGKLEEILYNLKDRYVIYSEKELDIKESIHRPYLVLGKGLEGLWVWKELENKIFFQEDICFFEKKSI